MRRQQGQKGLWITSADGAQKPEKRETGRSNAVPPTI